MRVGPVLVAGASSAGPRDRRAGELTEPLSPTTRAAAGLDALAPHCTERLQALLAQPPRAADDWSMDLPGGCSCELCEVLGGFLCDPALRSMEWVREAQARRRDESDLTWLTHPRD